MRQALRRVAVQSNVIQRSRSFTFPAPTRGLILSENAAAARPAGASVLDNWFPTQTGIKIRGGCRKVATIGSTLNPAISMFAYVAGTLREMFASTTSSVFKVNDLPDETTPPAAEFTGQTDGYYSAQQIATAGGTFLYAVNGYDKPRLYDGTTWAAIDAASTPALTPPTIPGFSLDTKRFSHVWSFKNRLFFVERGSMNAWCLPVDSIGGALTQISLAGVFQKGGSLFSGATWSLDTGDGLDDQCVFISSEGEVAIYQGTDPSSATSWAIKGRYEVSPPMGRRALMSVGGDLMIATRDGIVPLSEITTKDSSALTLSAVTRNIEPAWKVDVAAQDQLPWEIIKWPAQNKTIVLVPDTEGYTPHCWIVNMQTGAWCRYTGWSMRCMTMHRNQIYFGTAAGKIMAAETGGSDDGTIYTSSYAGLYDHLRAIGAIKQVHSARTIFLASQPFTPRVSVGMDYAAAFPTPPSAAIASGGENAWDAGLWDQAIWDAGTIGRVQTRWSSIGAAGISIAPQLQVTSGSGATPDAELIAFDIIYESGGVMV